ncbi:MAG TPA: NAD(P)-binding protein [Rhodocyclaceae bacterium]
MKRRAFLAACAAAPLAGCLGNAVAPLPPGDLGGSDAGLGHRLRAGDFPAPSETRSIPLLIVGAGIGGLSAGWKLQRAGFGDFKILELEQSPGGNARYGQNAVSAYPLGAHYLPLPTREARAVRELLADLGVLQGDPQAPRPTYDERYLCHVPQERLYQNGVWHEGLLPRAGLGTKERAQEQRFRAQMAEFRQARDSAGRRAFALPLALSSPDPRWRRLDRITMRDWLLAEGYDAPQLHWYVNYACRDDYGTDYSETSAWAGIHYYACRDGGAANAAEDSVLTAPEGNGWIVRALQQRLGQRIESGRVACRVQQRRDGVAVDVWQPVENRVVRWRAQQLIWAAPLFLLPRLTADLPPPLAAACASDHAPWLVANLTLHAPPGRGAGVPLAWDNVLYDSPGLGYVVATHQNIRVGPGPTVLTYYRPFSGEAPAAARQRLLAARREHWAGEVLADLGRAHRDLGHLVQRLDVFRHGHAMIRPVPGRLWGGARALLEQPWGRLRFAHADASGMSLFEEANYRGVRAAEQAMTALGMPHSSSLG